MKILILEDEKPAYNKLLTCLQNYFKSPISHDRVGSNTEGKKLLLKNKYDLILSDIKLLDGISFDLFDEIQTNTPIIFCSAHDDYLFRAFNTNGIAYILKPYSQDVFNKAIDKYQNLFNKGIYSNIDSNTISELKNALNNENKNYKKRFVIKKPEGIELLNTKDIALIQAEGDFCIATDYKGNRFIISNSLTNTLNLLDPKYFFKINRSEIVNINFIKNIKPHTKNRLFIYLVDTNISVLTSSNTTSGFRKWLES